MSRFILRLQSANISAVGSTTSTQNLSSVGGSVVFERVVGSLGAPISPDDYVREGEDDWNEGGEGEPQGEVEGPSQTMSD